MRFQRSRHDIENPVLYADLPVFAIKLRQVHGLSHFKVTHDFCDVEVASLRSERVARCLLDVFLTPDVRAVQVAEVANEVIAVPHADHVHVLADGLRNQERVDLAIVVECSGVRFLSERGETQFLGFGNKFGFCADNFSARQRRRFLKSEPLAHLFFRKLHGPLWPTHFIGKCFDGGKKVIRPTCALRSTFAFIADRYAVSSTSIRGTHRRLRVVDVGFR